MTKKRRKLGGHHHSYRASSIVCGVIFHYLIPGTVRDDVFVDGLLHRQPGFIRLMQMLVVPLVFCSIICGAALYQQPDPRHRWREGASSTYARPPSPLAALGVGNLINRRGVDMSSIVVSDTSTLDTASAASELSIADTLLNIIPKNPIQSLANGDMLPVIFFALFVGIIIALLGRKAETVHSFFEQFNDIMMKMTSIVMLVAPIGVFCLLSRTFANIGFDAFLPMVKYMLGVLLALLCNASWST
ncbi:MAG: dicarboxylate/amino acid:cation symporter [Eggerthellaceae bacterium]